MKKRYLLLSLLLISGFLTLVSRSGGPGTLLQQQVTGAPGETTCANCHFGGSGGGDLNIQVPGLSGGLQAGRTYQVEVILSDPDALVGGMQIVALDANLQRAGSFSPPPGMQTVFINGREYLEHSSPQLFDFSALPTSTTWVFDWTAPPSVSGMVTFYAAGVAADWTGGNDNDDVYTGQFSLAALPVEWLSFSAEALIGGRVQLSWSTAREINSGFFEVQRSADGNLFESVGDLAAQGYSESPVFYRFEDQIPRLGQTYFFRLKQVDQDGQQQFSEVKAVFVPESSFELLRVYPNPVIRQDFLEAEILLPEAGEALLQLRSAEGRVWPISKQVLSAGLHTCKVPVGDLPAGQYYLEGIWEDVYQVKKVVVVH